MNLLVEHYRAMASYNAWANRRLHKVCCRLSDQEFALPRTRFFLSIQLTRNRPDDSFFADKVCHPMMTELSAARRDLDRRLISVCNSLDAAELKRVVVLDRGADGTHRKGLHRSCFTFFKRQIHHRGQATVMLAGSQEKAPQPDEFFLLADWPARNRGLAMPANSAQAATLRRRR